MAGPLNEPGYDELEAEARRRGLIGDDTEQDFVLQEAVRRGLVPPDEQPPRYRKNGILDPNEFLPSAEVIAGGKGPLQPLNIPEQGGFYQQRAAESGYSLDGTRGDDYIFSHPDLGGRTIDVPRDNGLSDDPLARPADDIEGAFESFYQNRQFEQGNRRRSDEAAQQYRNNPLNVLAAEISGINNWMYGGADDDIMGFLGNEGYESSQDRLREEFPGAFQGGQMAGGIVPFGMAARLAQPKNVGEAIVMNGAVGGLQGSIHGFGDADAPGQDRFSASRVEGAYGMGGGAVFAGGVASMPVLGQVLKTISPAELRSVASIFARDFRTPSQLRNDPGRIGDTLDANLQMVGDVSPQALSVLNRVLRKSGMSDDDILRISKSVEGAQLGGTDSSLYRRTLAERYMSALHDDHPQAHDDLMTVLREGGMLGGGKNQSARITRYAADGARESQADFLEGRSREAFGSAAQLDQSDDIIYELARIGDEQFNTVLARGFRDASQEQVLRKRLSGPVGQELRRIVRADAAREGIDIDEFIDRNPAAAAHWMQSFAGQKANDLIGTAEGIQYAKMRDHLVDPLRRGVRGYAEAQANYADEATAAEAVKMGDRFFTIAKNETGLDKFQRDYNALPENAKSAAMASVRNSFIAKLRAGQEGGSVRFGEIASRGYLNGLESVFGREGKALADDIRALRNERDFFNTIDPRANSRTISNADAKTEGQRLTNNPVANALEDGAGGAIAGDMLISSVTGQPTGVLSTLKLGKGTARYMSRVKPKTRNQFTGLMMSRPDGALQVPVPARQLPGPNRGRYAPDGNRALNAPQEQRINLNDLYEGADPMNPMGRGPIAGGVDEFGRLQPTQPGQGGAPRGDAAPARTQRPQTLTGFIRAEGGINDEGGEISAILGASNRVPGLISGAQRGGQFSVSGRQVDDMLQRAKEEGFLPPNAERQDLFDALQRDVASMGDDAARVYPEYGDQAQAVHTYRAELDDPKNNGFVAGGPVRDAVAGGVIGGLAPADSEEERLRNAIAMAVGGAALSGRGPRAGSQRGIVQNGVAARAAAPARQPASLDGIGLTRPQRAAADLAIQGRTNAQIATELNLSPRSVSVYLTNTARTIEAAGQKVPWENGQVRNQVLRPRREKVPFVSNKQQVLDLYNQGRSVDHIRTKTGLSQKQLHAAFAGLKRDGAIDVAPSLRIPRAPRVTPERAPKVYEKVIEMARSGMSRAEIADEMLTSPEAVSTMLSRARNRGDDIPTWKGGRQTDKMGFAREMAEQGYSIDVIVQRLNAQFGEGVMHGGTDTTSNSVASMLSRQRRSLRDQGEIPHFVTALMAVAGLGAVANGLTPTDGNIDPMLNLDMNPRGTGPEHNALALLAGSENLSNGPPSGVNALADIAPQPQPALPRNPIGNALAGAN